MYVFFGFLTRKEGGDVGDGGGNGDGGVSDEHNGRVIYCN